jgi:hypothetical protein
MPTDPHVDLQRWQTSFLFEVYLCPPASHTYAGSFCYLYEVFRHDHCVTEQLLFVKAAMQVNYEPMLFCECLLISFSLRYGGLRCLNAHDGVL